MNQRLVAELLRLRQSRTCANHMRIPVSPEMLALLIDALDALDDIHLRAFRVVGYGLGVEDPPPPKGPPFGSLPCDQMLADALKRQKHGGSVLRVDSAGTGGLTITLREGIGKGEAVQALAKLFDDAAREV